VTPSELTHAVEPAARTTGLTAAEVAERIAAGQVNGGARSDWHDYADIVRRNLLTLFNFLVAPSALALFLLDEYRAAWAVSAMAVVNSAIGLFQEIRAKRHLDKLALLAETRAHVIRDGQMQSIPASAVVQDDVILLESGEPVVADGPVLSAHFLEVDEALLTGESDPNPRSIGDRLLSGTVCVAGQGSYRAEGIGGGSVANQTTALARKYHHAASPLQRIIDRLIRILSFAVLVLCASYIGLYFLHDLPGKELAHMVAATVTSLVPQGLVLMATMSLTLAAVRMSSRGALVQRLSAIESMASVSVLCLDKTGTLTTNRLCLDQLRLLDGSLTEQEVRTRLQWFAWSSTDEKNRSILALRTALGELPAEPAAELLDHIPFKAQNRYSAVRIRCGPTERLLVLGAWDALGPFLDDTAAEPSEKIWRELLPTGLRLLLFAEGGHSSENQKTRNPEPFGKTLQPLALIALSDELRPEARTVLHELAAQGVRAKIISGDHPETVAATVAHLQLPLRADRVVFGSELASGGLEPQRLDLVQSHDVFGRVTPQQKIEIVRTLQHAGQHVAMIGDGVNDILAIKRADLGIAMGEGSPATRTVAGLVLENNDFSLLPATLDEGRLILRNVRRAAKLFLLKNVYALFLIIMSVGVFGLGFPFRGQQVTLLNALTIGIPAFAIMLNRQRCEAPARQGFLREVGWFVLPTGLLIGTAALLVFLISARLRLDPIETQRTLVLSTLVLLGAANLFRVVSHGEAAGSTDGNPVRLLAVLAVPVYLGAMYIPLAADFFELTMLDLSEWLLVLTAAGVAFAMCKVVDWMGGDSKDVTDQHRGR
jgi:cation-transporting P-type ATPase E